MKQILFDAETNGFLYDVTEMHCSSFVTGEDNVFCPSVCNTTDSGVLLTSLKEADMIIGHNITGFDIPMIDKLYPGEIEWTSKVIYDTFLASCLAFPDSNHGHSIEAWAEYLRLPLKKVPITDWSTYTPLMGERCENDVGINLAVYEAIIKQAEIPKNVMDLECMVAMIHARQEMYGVLYDQTKASALYSHLEDELKLVREKITEGIPPTCKLVGTTLPYYGDPDVRQPSKGPYKQDGTLTAAAQKALNNHVVPPSGGGCIWPSAVGVFNRVEFVPFNLDSPKQVQQFLLSQGWKPTEWNFKREPGGKMVKTSPKLTESSWDSLPGDLGEMIGKYKMMSHRKRSIYNQQKNGKERGALSTVRSDGRVPAQAMTCATPTSRYRHMKTVCNIPRPKSPYGKEIRSLFTVPEDAWMIGVDLSGIEARMMCHYARRFPGGEELVLRVLQKDKTKDFHVFNSDVWDCSRDQAKNGLYALMYGCGEAKLASQLGKSKGTGGHWFDLFWQNNEALKHLIDELEGAFKSGRTIYGLDRRVLHIREARMALNTLLQGGAAVVFKVWMALVHKWIREQGLRPVLFQTIAYHDELQFEFHGTRDQAENVAKEICRLATEAGKLLEVRVPIEAAANIGKNWAETH
jgi:hypothetical protein